MPHKILLVQAVVPHEVGVAAKSLQTCNLFFLVNMPVTLQLPPSCTEI